MRDKASPDTPRLIKRYENRKLYDSAGRRHVTLEDLAAMIARGGDLRVLDQKTGEDVTALTLAQVLLEALKQRTARIPRQVLAHLLRLGFGPRPAWGEWVGPREAAARAREDAERIAGRLLSRGRLSLEDALALRREIAESVQRIVSEAQEGVENRVRSLLAFSTNDADASLHGLRDRLRAFETYLGRPRPRGGRRRAKPGRRPAGPGLP